jgi:hypothetical protein
MNSEATGMPASKCIDGETGSGCTYCNSYLCHSFGPHPDWLVITVTGYDINKIVVYNRLDACCSFRINNAKLIYSRDFAGSSVIYQSTFGETSLVYTFTFSNTPTQQGSTIILFLLLLLIIITL